MYVSIILLLNGYLIWPFFNSAKTKIPRNHNIKQTYNANFNTRKYFCFYSIKYFEPFYLVFQQNN